MSVLNPDDQPVSEEEERMLLQELQRFRVTEGLTEDDSPELYYGYLSRGHCLGFLRTTGQKLYNMRLEAAERKAEL